MPRRGEAAVAAAAAPADAVGFQHVRFEAELAAEMQRRRQAGVAAADDRDIDLHVARDRRRVGDLRTCGRSPIAVHMRLTGRVRIDDVDGHAHPFAGHHIRVLAGTVDGLSRCGTARNRIAACRVRCQGGQFARPTVGRTRRRSRPGARAWRADRRVAAGMPGEGSLPGEGRRKGKVLYDTLEMEPPPVDVPLAQQATGPRARLDEVAARHRRSEQSTGVSRPARIRRRRISCLLQRHRLSREMARRSTGERLGAMHRLTTIAQLSQGIADRRS